MSAVATRVKRSSCESSFLLELMIQTVQGDFRTLVIGELTPPPIKNCCFVLISFGAVVFLIGYESFLINFKSENLIICLKFIDIIIVGCRYLLLLL